MLSFSRVSELQIRKRWCPWRQMPFPIYWGWRTDQQEVEERWCERISCDIEGVYAVGLCVLRLLLVKVYSTWTWKIGIKSHRRMLQRHMAPNQNSGKKGSIAKIQKSVPLERSFCAPELKEIFLEETLHQERCARKAVWDMAKILKSSRIRTIFRLTFSVTSKGCQHLPFRRDQMSEHSLSIQHGCSYEWVSGQQPRLTQNGKRIFCKTDSFVPLVFPGLSVNSGNSSSSATLPQESLEPDAHFASRNRAASSSSSDSVLEWSDEPAPRRLVQESLSDDKKDAKDPLADLPFLVEGFQR